MTGNDREEKRRASVAVEDDSAGNAAAEKRLVRKTDILMMPGLGLTYFTHTLGAAGATNFAGIMATRIVMGAVEAAYKPCEVYYLSLFYTRKEMGFRVCWIGQMGFIAVSMYAAQSIYL